MKYENYRLPGGKTLSEGTFEDIRWQYGVFRCNSTGAGRDKKYTPWRAVKTKLGEIEECDWCKLVEAVIERENEVPLLNALIQTSLDKGTQRKTTENELPSLTQCTA